MPERVALPGASEALVDAARKPTASWYRALQQVAARLGSGRLTGQIVMPDLPTADPHLAGQLWNDGGTLKVSAG